MKHIRAISALLVLLLLVGPCNALAGVLELPIDFSGGTKPLEKYVSNMPEYEDPSIHVTRRSGKTTLPDGSYTFMCALRVQIANATQLRTMSAAGFDVLDRFAGAKKLSNRVNAVVAFNGDYFCGDAKRFVLRQGIVYKESMAPGQDLLLIDEDGDFHIILAEEHPEEMDKTQINGKKVINALCFGPALIKDGKVNTNHDSAPTYCDPQKKNERVVFCQIGPLDYMVVTVHNRGMELDELTDFILSLQPDVQQAYNLDGGISSEVFFLGHRVSNTSRNPEDYRNLADIVCFASAYEPD